MFRHSDGKPAGAPRVILGHGAGIAERGGGAIPHHDRAGAASEALGAGVLRIQSWKGTAFEVQASTDLDQGSPVTTVTNLTGTLEFTDPNAANYLQRFYRTLLR